MTSLREALAAKRVREATFPVAIADPQPAEQALLEAKQRLVYAGIGKTDPEETKAAEESFEKAAADLEACFYRMQLHALPPSDYEALRDEHTNEAGDVDLGSFLPALVAVSVVDGNLTAEEWAVELASDRWTSGDKQDLLRRLVDLNAKPISAGLPKG